MWTKTPREAALIFDARARALEREHNDLAWLAWHIAALTRVKKLPKLQSLMHRKSRSNPQTPEQQLAIVKMLNAAYGGLTISRTEH